MSRIGWATLAVLVAVLLGLLLLLKQGDCNRSDDDGGDDGMEPAETCKPGDNSCNAGEPAPTRPSPRATPEP